MRKVIVKVLAVIIFALAIPWPVLSRLHDLFADAGLLAGKWLKKIFK